MPLGSLADQARRSGTLADPVAELSLPLYWSTGVGATTVGGMPSATTRLTLVDRVSVSPTPVIVSG